MLVMMMMMTMMYAVMVTHWMVMYAEDQVLVGPKLLKAAYHDLHEKGLILESQLFIVKCS